MINEILVCLKRADAAISVSKLTMETLTGLKGLSKHVSDINQQLPKQKRPTQRNGEGYPSTNEVKRAQMLPLIAQ